MSTLRYRPPVRCLDRQRCPTRRQRSLSVLSWNDGQAWPPEETVRCLGRLTKEAQARFLSWFRCWIRLAMSAKGSDRYGSHGFCLSHRLSNGNRLESSLRILLVEDNPAALYAIGKPAHEDLFCFPTEQRRQTHVCYHADNHFSRAQEGEEDSTQIPFASSNI